MTIKQAKADILKTVEALQKDGVMVHRIEIGWSSEVGLSDDKPVPTGALKCDIRIEADL